MKKAIVFIFISLIFSFSVLAQDAEPEFEEDEVQKEKPKKKLSKKITFGGSFGLTLGTYTRVAVSPIVGFRPIERVLLGVEGRYVFIKNYYSSNSSHCYGYGPFARLILFKGFYFQAQAEFMSYDNVVFDENNPGRKNNIGLMLGGGYRQQIGERAYSFVSILYDINETANSFYLNPIIRFGITF